MTKILPYHGASSALQGVWEWGASWEFFLGNGRPMGAESTSAGCILLCPTGFVFTTTVDRGGYELPCGRRHQDESIFDTLRREVREEAGEFLIDHHELGVKVIYNPPGQVVINSETGKPFPHIGFQEYFVGWCSGELLDPTGEEVIEATIVTPEDIGPDFLRQLPEPREFCMLITHMQDLVDQNLLGENDLITYWKEFISPITNDFRIFLNELE